MTLFMYPNDGIKAQVSRKNFMNVIITLGFLKSNFQYTYSG